MQQLLGFGIQAGKRSIWASPRTKTTKLTYLARLAPFCHQRQECFPPHLFFHLSRTLAHQTGPHVVLLTQVQPLDSLQRHQIRQILKSHRVTWTHSVLNKTWPNFVQWKLSPTHRMQNLVTAVVEEMKEKLCVHAHACDLKARDSPIPRQDC